MATKRRYYINILKETDDVRKNMKKILIILTRAHLMSLCQFGT